MKKWNDMTKEEQRITEKTADRMAEVLIGVEGILDHPLDAYDATFIAHTAGIDYLAMNKEFEKSSYPGESIDVAWDKIFTPYIETHKDFLANEYKEEMDWEREQDARNEVLEEEAVLSEEEYEPY